LAGEWCKVAEVFTRVVNAFAWRDRRNNRIARSPINLLSGDDHGSQEGSYECELHGDDGLKRENFWRRGVMMMG
jgi:hypothetical protein